MQKLSNTNVLDMTQLTTPKELRERYPRSEKASATVEQGRQEITDILDHKDHRLLVVVGPCSIHDIDLAKEYAERLLSLRKELASSLNIVTVSYTHLTLPTNREV